MNTTTAQTTIIITTTQPKPKADNQIKKVVTYDFGRPRIVEKVRGFVI